MMIAAGFAVVGLAAGQAAAESNPSAALLAGTCAGCHGTNGVSGGPAMPTIAGMPKGLVVSLMTEFKSGDRPSTIMQRIAKGYTDKQIAQLGDFFLAQKWQNATSLNPLLASKATQVDMALAAKGKDMTKQCSKCHEDDGRSTVDDTGRLAGQWVDYLLFKMADYKNPDMDVPQGKKMKKQMDTKSLEELNAIAHFYASQK
jgi:sulfide dehydrogenase cytochrome subunit